VVVVWAFVVELDGEPLSAFCNRLFVRVFRCGVGGVGGGVSLTDI